MLPNKVETFLKNLFRKKNLIDCWRVQNPTKRKFTWSQKNPSIRCRLDYFFIKENICNEIKSCRIIPGISSDHEIVEIVINVGKQTRGPGLWKLNNSLLNDAKYKEKIKLLIENIWSDNTYISDLRVRFDFLKFEIMRYSRKVS